MSGQSRFVLVYTPLCGTCKLALRMLDIVEAADPTLRIERRDLNIAPELAQRWRIRSVPALVHVLNGGASDILYRLESVDRMYRWLQLHREKEEQEHES
jgi:thioredoxin-like negative regulator of GroEL